jgi:hypothetical protein
MHGSNKPYTQKLGKKKPVPYNDSTDRPMKPKKPKGKKRGCR